MLKNRQSSNFSEECGLGWGGDREEEDGGEVTLQHHLLLPYPHCGVREKTRPSRVGFWQRMPFRRGSGIFDGGASWRLNNAYVKRRIAACALSIT